VERGLAIVLEADWYAAAWAWVADLMGLAS